MFGYRVQETARIDAPAEQVYSIIADYRNGHPCILPREYFTELVVEQGGLGEGTVIRFGMRAMGTTRTIRARIAEPHPGRVLTETDLATGTVTTFTVVPDGTGADVSIATELRVDAGVSGWLDRFLATALHRRVFVRELQLLAAVACNKILHTGTVG
jgi:hypothetical protein